MRGIIGKNDKGFYTIINGQFAIIDRYYQGENYREGEEWEFSVLKVIKDRRGNSVPILRPESRVERVVFEGDSVIIKSGDITLKKLSIQEALDEELISIEEEKTDILPFMGGYREIKYRAKDGAVKYKWEESPPAQEELSAIEMDRKAWRELLSSKENREEYEKYSSLKGEEKSLLKQIDELERKLEELKKPPVIEREFDWNAFKTTYVFSLTKDGEVVPFELRSYDWREREEGDPRHYRASICWDNIPFDREAIKNILLRIKRKKEEEIPVVQEQLQTAQQELKKIREAITSLDRERVRLYALYLNSVKDEESFTEMWRLDLGGQVLPDEQFRETLPFEVKSPQGLAVATSYLQAIPASLDEALQEDYSEHSDAVQDFVNWFVKRWQNRSPNCKNPAREVG